MTKYKVGELIAARWFAGSAVWFIVDIVPKITLVDEDRRFFVISSLGDRD